MFDRLFLISFYGEPRPALRSELTSSAPRSHHQFSTTATRYLKYLRLIFYGDCFQIFPPPFFMLAGAMIIPVIGNKKTVFMVISG